MIQPMMVPNLEIRNLSPTLQGKVFIAYFVHLLYFVYCCNVFPTHKEWRFIVYTIPTFTLQAANGVTNICQNGVKLLNKVLILLLGQMLLLVLYCRCTWAIFLVSITQAVTLYNSQTIIF